jgi:long-chain acyl-CoA synthetase
VTAFALIEADLLRVCRDLAYSEIATMPGLKARLGPRLTDAPGVSSLSWAADALDLDSLARMQLATAGAVWCNAYDAGFEDLFLAKRNVADWAGVMHRARQAGAAQITFATSGSTGARKLIRHREDILADEARVWAKALGPVKRIVVLCPTHHIYGFIWGVLLPLALGVPAIDADLAHMPALQPQDLLVAVPDQWSWLAASPRQWPAGVQGISSTAPLAAAVHDALTVGQAHPLAQLWQIYGSTETAGLAYRHTSAGPYTLASGRLRNAQDGIDLQLPSGKLQPMAVQDTLQWTGPDSFELLRRSDDSVQIGGHNVSPAWVVGQLMGHSAVKEATVRLDLEHTPSKLKAFVVLHDSAQTETSAELEQWIADQLPWYATFSSITYGAQLPRNVMGKAADWQPIR